MKNFNLLILISFLATTSSFANDFQIEAAQALMPFKKSLMGKLKAGMEKGASDAVKTCNLEAPKITKEHSNGKYLIGRTSNKYRNTDNSPQEWMKSVLAEYEKTDGKKPLAPRVIKLKNGKSAYVEPIYIKGLCLNCHGAKIQSDLEKEIASKYPNDKAKGFKLNEFRGLFWVTEK